MFKNYSKVNFLSPGEALTKRLYYKVSEVLSGLDYLYSFALKMSVLAFQLPKNPSQIPVCVKGDSGPKYKAMTDLFLKIKITFSPVHHRRV